MNPRGNIDYKTKTTEWQTDEWPNKQTDRQTGSQTKKQTGRHGSDMCFDANKSQTVKKSRSKTATQSALWLSSLIILQKPLEGLFHPACTPRAPWNAVCQQLVTLASGGRINHGFLEHTDELSNTHARTHRPPTP